MSWWCFVAERIRFQNDRGAWPTALDWHADQWELAGRAGAATVAPAVSGAAMVMRPAAAAASRYLGMRRTRGWMSISCGLRRRPAPHRLSVEPRWGVRRTGRGRAGTKARNGHVVALCGGPRVGGR